MASKVNKRYSTSADDICFTIKYNEHVIHMLSLALQEAEEKNKKLHNEIMRLKGAKSAGNRLQNKRVRVNSKSKTQ